MQAAATCLPGPSSPQFAPLRITIPSIPAKFTAAAAAGELLHAIDAEGGEEPPLVVSVGKGQHLSLPRCHKRRVVSTFGEWSRCFAVYASTLCAYQPLRGPDMLAYLYLLAAAQQEFNLPACLAYDVAFRRKAGRFHLSTLGQLDPQLYAKAFTGVGKATPSATSSCAPCLEATHSTAECS